MTIRESYTPPTSNELRMLLKKWELTGSQWAGQVGISGSSARIFTGGKKQLPYGILFTLFAKNDGIFIGGDWRDEVSFYE